MRVAAVDCGTNSVRLLVAERAELGLREVHREMRVVRLGEGVDRYGRLAHTALERTRTALLDYAAVCAALGVERTRFVATSATRDAENRVEFVNLVQDVMGVTPEVVSGQEEASLAYAGATAGLDLAQGPFAVIDIGGGSTEVVVGDAVAQASCSVDIGCVRLTERHLHSDPPTSDQIASAQADVAAALERISQAVPTASVRTAIGVAGSVTTIAALALELPAYQPERIHQSRVSLRQVRTVTARLLSMSKAERAGLGVMHPGRADVIGGGALVLLAAMEHFEWSEMLVSESDILDGIALSIR